MRSPDHRIARILIHFVHQLPLQPLAHAQPKQFHEREDKDRILISASEISHMPRRMLREGPSRQRRKAWGGSAASGTTASQSRGGRFILSDAVLRHCDTPSRLACERQIFVVKTAVFSVVRLGRSIHSFGFCNEDERTGPVLRPAALLEVWSTSKISGKECCVRLGRRVKISARRATIGTGSKGRRGQARPLRTTQGGRDHGLRQERCAHTGGKCQGEQY